jgi:rhodanese-related sulfurtransferase
MGGIREYLPVPNPITEAHPNRDRAPPRNRALLLSCLLLVSQFVGADEKPYAPDSIPGAVIVSAEQVIELILAKPELVIIDSRKKSEFTKGHIESAVNLLNTSLRQDDLQAACPDKSTPIVFYCNGTRCLRSSDAVRKAMDWGYQNVFWFRGGWKEWTDKRLPVVSN